MQLKSTKKKRSFWKIFLAILGSVVALLVISGWIFFTFYFEGVLNSKITPKLNDGVRTASHGRYALKLGHLSYSNGTILGKNISLYRLRYDSNEVGIVVKRLQIDTVLFSGIDWWALILGKGLYIDRLDVKEPKVYLVDANEEESSQDLMKKDTAGQKPLTMPDSLPSEVPVIAVGSINLTKISLFLPKDTLPQTILAADSTKPLNLRRHPVPSFANVTFNVTNFLLDATSLKNKPLFFSKRVEFNLPDVRYDLADSMFSLHAHNMHGVLSDSVLSIDSLWYSSNYSHDAFAAKHKYYTGELDFRCGHVRLRGIDFPSLLSARGIVFRTLEARTWAVSFYLDKRKPMDPHPPAAVLPNDMVSAHPFAIDLDSVILGDGHIAVSERMPGSEHAGLLTFEHAHVCASPFSTDTGSPRFSVPTRITFDAYFVGEAKVVGVAVYPLQNKPFDLDIDATVTKFSAKKLNAWLITNERMEVEDGELESGDIKMHIRDGVGTTSVTPRYRNLAINVLNGTPGKSRGILEGIKTFIAKVFVMRSNNLAENGKPAITGTTTRRRAKPEEFMQFIWLALRKSLGKVVGGFQ